MIITQLISGRNAYLWNITCNVAINQQGRRPSNEIRPIGSILRHICLWVG